MKTPFAVLVLFGWLVGNLPAQTALPEGKPLLAGDTSEAFRFIVAPEQTGAGKFSVVDAQGPGFTRAWRIETVRDASPMASIELRALNEDAVAAGDVAMIRFFARKVSASDETGNARITLVVRRDGVDFNSSYEGSFSFGREWQEVLVPFVFAKDFAANEAAVMFRFGFKRQSVELGGLDVVYYGKARSFASLPRTRFTYQGREAGAAWREAALARIEKIRKGDLRIHVVDADGRPAKGAAVKVEQTRQAFQFGSALQFSRLVHDTPENLRYQEKVLELFNAASPENDLKWVTWAGDWGADFSPEQSVAGLRWLRAHDFHTRGHVLVWPGWKNLPAFVQKLRGTPEEKAIAGIVEKHIREMTRATRGLVDEWDVLNEPFSNHDLMDIFGDGIMADWFKIAREELPTRPLFLNDFSNHDLTTDADHVAHFEKTIRRLRADGAPLDGLGLQAHFDGKPNDPENILAVLDRYWGEFKLPVRVTEFDVWTFDEELQADFTRDFLILAFSHPSVEGVQLWGFWESAHWRPSAAMYRADWSEKPNAAVYRDLVLKQWRTRLNGQTGDDGEYAARGFFGDYVVTVERDGRKASQGFSLVAGADAPEWTITLR
jgi:GH35 family endo-1,4-beta-xylanase